MKTIWMTLTKLDFDFNNKCKNDIEGKLYYSQKYAVDSAMQFSIASILWHMVLTETTRLRRSLEKFWMFAMGHMKPFRFAIFGIIFCNIEHIFPSRNIISEDDKI